MQRSASFSSDCGALELEARGEQDDEAAPWSFTRSTATDDDVKRRTSSTMLDVMTSSPGLGGPSPMQQQYHADPLPAFTISTPDHQQRQWAQYQRPKPMRNYSTSSLSSLSSLSSILTHHTEPHTHTQYGAAQDDVQLARWLDQRIDFTAASASPTPTGPGQQQGTDHLASPLALIDAAACALPSHSPRPSTSSSSVSAFSSALSPAPPPLPPAAASVLGYGASARVAHTSADPSLMGGASYSRTAVAGASGGGVAPFAHQHHRRARTLSSPFDYAAPSALNRDELARLDVKMLLDDDEAGGDDDDEGDDLDCYASPGKSTSSLPPPPSSSFAASLPSDIGRAPKASLHKRKSSTTSSRGGGGGGQRRRSQSQSSSTTSTSTSSSSCSSDVLAAAQRAAVSDPLVAALIEQVQVGKDDIPAADVAQALENAASSLRVALFAAQEPLSGSSSSSKRHKKSKSEAAPGSRLEGSGGAHAKDPSIIDAVLMQFARTWLLLSYTVDSGSSVCRRALYASYLGACGRIKLTPISPANFGKVIKMAFPDATNRRLGVRGASRYHISGVRPAHEAEKQALARVDEPTEAQSPDSERAQGTSMQELYALATTRLASSQPKARRASSGDVSIRRSATAFDAPLAALPPPHPASLQSTSSTDFAATYLRHVASEPSMFAAQAGAETQPRCPIAPARTRETSRSPIKRRGTSANLSISIVRSPLPAVVASGGLSDSDKTLGASMATAIPGRVSGLIGFPSIESVLSLPAQDGSLLDAEAAQAAWARFSEFCRKLLASVKQQRFDHFELMLRTWWHLRPPADVAIFADQRVAALVLRAEELVWDEVLGALQCSMASMHPDLVHAVRGLASHMEEIVLDALGGLGAQPERVELATRFGHLVIRLLQLSSAAGAVTHLFENAATMGDVQQAWKALDVEALSNHVALMTDCPQGSLQTCLARFGRLLCGGEGDASEALTAERVVHWLDETFELYLSAASARANCAPAGTMPGHVTDNARTGGNTDARALLMRWNFVTTQLARELCSTSVKSDTTARRALADACAALNTFVSEHLSFSVLRREVFQRPAILHDASAPPAAQLGVQAAVSQQPQQQAQSAFESLGLDFFSAASLLPNFDLSSVASPSSSQATTSLASSTSYLSWPPAGTVPSFFFHGGGDLVFSPTSHESSGDLMVDTSHSATSFSPAYGDSPATSLASLSSASSGSTSSSAGTAISAVSSGVTMPLDFDPSAWPNNNISFQEQQQHPTPSSAVLAQDSAHDVQMILDAAGNSTISS